MFIVSEVVRCNICHHITAPATSLLCSRCGSPSIHWHVARLENGFQIWENTMFPDVEYWDHPLLPTFIKPAGSLDVFLGVQA